MKIWNFDCFQFCYQACVIEFDVCALLLWWFKIDFEWNFKKKFSLFYCSSTSCLLVVFKEGFLVFWKLGCSLNSLFVAYTKRRTLDLLLDFISCLHSKLLFLPFKKEKFCLRLGHHIWALDLGFLIGFISFQDLYDLLSLMHIGLSRSKYKKNGSFKLDSLMFLRNLKS